MPRRQQFEQFVHLRDDPPEEICYLYHLDPPYEHAAHYLGTRRIDSDRDWHHGTPEGARLLEVQQEAGGTWHLVRTWAGGRDKERQLKTRSGAQYCPDCTDHPLPGTSPRRPGARYLTRKQRHEQREQRLAKDADPRADLEMREATYAEVQEMLRPRRELLGGDRVQPVPELSDEQQVRHIEQLEATWRKAAPQYELEAG